MVTASTAVVRPRACHRWSAAGPPRLTSRSAPTATVIGLTGAKACSQPGTVATGTKAELVKIRGMTASSPPVPAGSASRTSSPGSAKIHEKAQLNRAVAVAMAYGPARGLDIADKLTAEPALAAYAQLPAVRGDLLAKLGRLDKARREFERAAALTGNERERALFHARAAGCAAA